MNNEMEIEPNERENGPNRSAWKMIETSLNVLNHIVACIASIYMSVVCYRAGSKAVTWHVWLCTIGVSGFDSFLENFL